jgi:hypothetical protein
MMAEQASLQSHKIKLQASEETKFVFSNFNIQKQAVISAALEDVSVIKNPPSMEALSCVCLNLEDLKCFESVKNQYEKFGVIFHNCIAIQPSNPAFPSHSGLMVLMGAPKSGFLEASFVRPVHSVSTYVTSSQRLVLSAYDGNRQLLTQEILPGANLANTDSAIPPNKLLTVRANNIHSVTFCAFDGQFTLDDFTFVLS